VAARPRSLTAAIAAAVLLLVAGCRDAAPVDRPVAQRVVSLVPAVTEMLFAVGAGSQVVGVSSYDHFPPDVERLPKVGALIDPDTERILSLRPDLVIVYGSQTDAEARFSKAGIRTYSYRHRTTSAVAATFDAITEIGALTGHDAQARDVVTRVSADLEAVRARVAGLPRPRTALVMGREPGTLQGIYVSGGTGFLHEVLDIAGGANAFGDIKGESAQPSTETLLARAPDVILELQAASRADIDRSMDVWKKLASIPAVRTSRVHAVIGDFVVVAGPRLARGTEAVARALHPDAFK
jgi:iron complex transport system substrate-binding protein